MLSCVEQEGLWECNLLADGGGEEVACGERIALWPGESKFFRFGMKRAAGRRQKMTTARRIPLEDGWRLTRPSGIYWYWIGAIVMKENGETLPEQTVMQAFNHLLRTRYQGG